MPNSSFFFAQISLVTLVHAQISFHLLSPIIYSVIYMSNKYLEFPLADSLTQFQGINTPLFNINLYCPLSLLTTGTRHGF